LALETGFNGSSLVQYNYDVCGTQPNQPELQLQLKGEFVGVSAAQVTCTSHSATKNIDSALDQSHLCLVLARCHIIDNLDDDRTSFMNDINQYIVLSPTIEISWHSGFDRLQSRF
jgi:hypothetical protein